MRSKVIVLRLLFATLSGAATTAVDTDTGVLHTTAEVRAMAETGEVEGHRFDLTGHIAARMPRSRILLQDATGGFEVSLKGQFHLNPGDVVTLTGQIHIEEDTGLPVLVTETATVRGTQSPPPPERTTVAAIVADEKPFHLLSVRGIVTDAFADEIDAHWNYFILRDGTDMAYAALPNANDMRSRLSQLEDAEVEIVGVSLPHRAGLRAFLGLVVVLLDESSISVLKPAPDDPFNLPALEDLRRVRPEKIAALGRRTVEGNVIAAWHGGHFLLREQTGRTIRVELADRSSGPRCGQHVKVVGHPETDLYRINLARAQFRAESGESRQYPEPKRVTPADILRNDVGEQMIKPGYHGQLVKLRGEVRILPTAAGGEKRFYIQSGEFLVPVDISARPDIATGLAVGCTVDVTGVCILDSPNWHPNLVFPHIEGMFLVPRSPTDVRIVANPSWWTPRRLMILVGALLALLMTILIWNMALRRLIERRGRELFKAEIGKVGAELRVDERTRLAVDLHDSLAQNLTAISFQVASAISAKEVAPAAAAVHLQNADKMLRSCRTELRRCLWDLRSDTLEEKDFSQAVKKTIEPVLGDAALHVRFNIPRSHVCDTTTHAVLNIIRELVSNAVRHGQARHIWVAGELTQRQLRFSVRDDGCGFNVNNHPGQDTGHFGLKGINERLHPLDGTLELSSSENGTRAVVNIHLSHREESNL